MLQLLHGPLSRREIGQVLSVSHNTIKSHTRAIYRKLGVSNRLEVGPPSVSLRPAVW